MIKSLIDGFEGVSSYMALDSLLDWPLWDPKVDVFIFININRIISKVFSFGLLIDASFLNLYPNSYLSSFVWVVAPTAISAFLSRNKAISSTIGLTFSLWYMILNGPRYFWLFSLSGLWFKPSRLGSFLFTSLCNLLWKILHSSKAYAPWFQCGTCT